MSHDKHQQFYDDLAAEWDLNYTAEDLERLSRLVDGLDIAPGSNILDLGCGTGILFDLLRRKVGPEGTVTGVDFSIEMARQAHRNFPFPNVNVVDADVTNLPFQDDSFDFAISFSAFADFSDKTRALQEIHRVLKTGGLFCIVYLVSSKELSTEHARTGGLVQSDELPSKETMVKLFEDTSFRTVKFEDHPGLYMACGYDEK